MDQYYLAFVDILLQFHCRIQVVKDGKKRKLVINGAKLDDAGKITAKTNADESTADLGVQCEYFVVESLSNSSNEMLYKEEIQPNSTVRMF